MNHSPEDFVRKTGRKSRQVEWGYWARGLISRGMI